MSWLRHILRKSPIFILSLLLVELFYMVDGQQFVYARQARQQQREMALQESSAVFGIPIE